MLLKDIYYLEVWQPLFQQNHLCNFGREYDKGQFCEIILAAPFVRWSGTICANLVEGIWKRVSRKTIL